MSDTTKIALHRAAVDASTIDALRELVTEYAMEAMSARIAATEQRMRAETMAARADIANDRLADRQDIDARLMSFALAVLRAWHGEEGARGDVEGGEVQRLAERAGVVVAEPRRPPCSDACPCAEIHGPGEIVRCVPIHPTIFRMMVQDSVVRTHG